VWGLVFGFGVHVPGFWFEIQGLGYLGLGYSGFRFD